MKKKFLEIILVLFMVLSIMPARISAEEEGDSVQTSEQEIVEAPAEAAEEGGEDEQQEEAETAPADELLPEEEDDQASVPVEELLLTEEEKAALAEKEEEEEQEDEKAVRTIMMYICGSDLETYMGMATYNIEQILNSNFSKDDKVKFIIMTGGAEEWYVSSDYLWDPVNEVELDSIGHEYNSIWEAKGQDADENPGKLVLLDGDGIFGDGEDAVRNEPIYIYDEEMDYWDELDIPYERMDDPEVLRAFIDYCVEEYPAEKYDLILWDHGGGPTGGFATDIYSGRAMPFGELLDALSNNEVINSGDKFDFIDFDACLMSSVEVILSLIGLTDYYLASPETIPGYGQQYMGWLEMLAEDPDANTYDLGVRLVEDFYEFYEKGYEDGTRQEGTMAIIDMNRLQESGFVELMKEFTSLFRSDIQDNMYYDEFQSIKNSIRYGENDFYDFGNLIAQISIKQRELEEDDIAEDGSINDRSRYYEVALAIDRILHDEKIIYNTVTHGISTGDFIYRDTDGKIKYSDINYSPLSSSGLHIFFIKPKRFREARDYFYDIGDAMDVMPDGLCKDILQEYRMAMLDLSVVVMCGQDVTYLVNNGTDKDTLDYSVLKEYWDEVYDTYEDIEFTQWDMFIKDMVGLRNHGTSDYPEGQEETEEYLEWMDTLIPQMAEEAVSKENVEVYEVNRVDGTGYQVRIGKTKKRVIDDITLHIVAELPLVQQFVEEEGLEWMLNQEEESDLAFSIGVLHGLQVLDMDVESSTEESFLADYIRWLNNDSSTWDIEGNEGKWYALIDAEGNYHILAIGQDTESLFTIATYKNERTVEVETEDGIEIQTIESDDYMGLYFEDGKITYLMMADESGNYRAVRPKELKKELTITPVTRAAFFTTMIDIPISTPFTLSAENADDIDIVFTDIDNIPDIADTDGDGKKIKNYFIVRDIYYSRIDISDKMDNPAGILTDIGLAEIQPAEYTGEELSPVIKVNGKTLVEGKDYILEKVSDDVVFLEEGDYLISLKGIGDYTGFTTGIFTIKPAPVRYIISEGGNGIWKKGSGNGLRFVFKRSVHDEDTIDHFQKVLIDDEEIDPSYYQVKSGSVVIILKPAFLEKQSAGDHTITAVFDDGSSQPVRFTIRKKDFDKKEDSSGSYKLPLTGVE